MLSFSTTAYELRDDRPSNTSVVRLSRQPSFYTLFNMQRQAYVASRSSTSWYQLHKKHALSESIAQLSKLEHDWDGEGAVAIAAPAISVALSLIEMMPETFPLPEFSPNPNGTISLYWSLPHGSAELEFGRTRYSWAIVDSAGKASTICSGENRVFDLTLLDLLSALAPSRSVRGTPPLTTLAMRHEWSAEADCF